MNITLKKDGWYVKLNKFIFTEEIRYASLCPQFWLTIYCIVAFLPICLFKAIKWLLVPIGNVLLNIINKLLCEPVYNSYVLHSPTETLEDGYYIYNRYPDKILDRWDLGKENYKKYSIFLKWKEKMGDKYEEHLNKLIEQEASEKQKRHELQVLLIQKKQEKQAKIKEIKSTPLVQNIIHYTSLIGKTIFWLGSGILASFILFILYKIIAWGVHFYNTHWFNWKAFYLFLFITVLTLVITLLVIILAFIINKIKNCDPITDFFTKIGKKFCYILISIASIFIYLWKGIKILFVLIKNSYCPLITWEE